MFRFVKWWSWCDDYYYDDYCDDYGESYDDYDYFKWLQRDSNPQPLSL